jgi:predicted RNase H-like nuclease (RuvC/YqgF family)
VNSVIILFVMELDERVFSTLAAYHEEKWTEPTFDEMTMKEQIASQQEELRTLREIVQSIEESQVQYIYKRRKFPKLGEMIARHKGQIAAQQEEIILQKEQIASQNDEVAMLREAVQKLRKSQKPQCMPANEGMIMHAAELEETSSDTCAGKGVQ